MQELIKVTPQHREIGNVTFHFILNFDGHVEGVYCGTVLEPLNKLISMSNIARGCQSNFLLILLN